MDINSTHIIFCFFRHLIERKRARSFFFYLNGMTFEGRKRKLFDKFRIKLVKGGGAILPGAGGEIFFSTNLV